MSRKVYLFVMNTMADFEPSFALSELVSGRFFKEPKRPFELVLCGQNRDPIRTMGGIPLIPQMMIEDITPDKESLLILPGSEIWLEPQQEQTIQAILRLLDSEMLIAAICGATMALAQAGALDHRPHTSNDIAALKGYCPDYKGENHYVCEPAVTDSNLITASGLAPIEFAFQIMKKLNVLHPSTLEAWYQLYTTRETVYYHKLVESLQK
jgi:putative intracellular protease/amidase